MRPENKRVGCQMRAEKARKYMKTALLDDTHPQHLTKDIEIARMFNVTRLTIYKIRDELGIPFRLERIRRKIKKIDTSRYTLKELASLLNIKYQNVYKVVRELNLPYKPDQDWKKV